MKARRGWGGGEWVRWGGWRGVGVELAGEVRVGGRNIIAKDPSQRAVQSAWR